MKYEEINTGEFEKPYNKTLHIQIERKARRTWQCPSIIRNKKNPAKVGRFYRKSKMDFPKF